MSFVAVAIGGSAIAGIVGSTLASGASKDAANAQVEGANHAADLQKKAADDSLAFQKEVFAQQQKNLAPWLSAGEGGLIKLSDAMGLTLTKQADGSWAYTPGGSGEFLTPASQAMKGWQTDPGYDFRLSEATKAIDRSAAARGGALSGRAAKELTRYSQDYASNEYQNVYNRFEQDRTSRFNKLASLAGIGQQSTAQLNQAGQTAANNMSDITMGSARTIGDLATQAGNARASGYVGSANAWNSGLSNIASMPMQYMMLSNIMKPNLGYQEGPWAYKPYPG